MDLSLSNRGATQSDFQEGVKNLGLDGYEPVPMRSARNLAGVFGLLRSSTPHARQNEPQQKKQLDQLEGRAVYSPSKEIYP